MTDFSIKREVLPDQDIVILRLSGCLDFQSYELLERELKALFDQGRSRIIVDLASLVYICSAGIGTLIRAQSEANENGGSIVLLNPSGNVRQIIDLGGLDQIFSVAGSRAEAMLAFD